jgi:PhnB protein
VSAEITPHLNFRGEARAALTFYARALGGDAVFFSYADAHAVQRPEESDWITWGQVRAGGLRIMAYDVPMSLEHDAGVIPFFVSLRGDDADELAGYWAGLADGATVVHDLGPAAWSPLYGMLRDRFGVTWVLDIAVG